MNAVITADIINSSALSANDENKVLEAIRTTLDGKHGRANISESSFRITRGDSIQIEMNDGKHALKWALLLKAAINKIILNGNSISKPEVDIRIAIGIGDIDGKREKVNESTGDAYSYSGRTLDAMKKNKRTFAIKTGLKDVDAELDTEFRLLEVIASNWKVTSSEVIYWILQGKNEVEISKELGITQSAINQRKKTAGWYGVEALINRFEELIREKTQ